MKLSKKVLDNLEEYPLDSTTIFEDRPDMRARVEDLNDFAKRERGEAMKTMTYAKAMSMGFDNHDCVRDRLKTFEDGDSLSVYKSYFSRVRIVVFHDGETPPTYWDGKYFVGRLDIEEVRKALAELEEVKGA